jgi:hypothetical protein
MPHNYESQNRIEQSRRMIMALATECVKQPHRLETLDSFVHQELTYLVNAMSAPTPEQQQRQ